MQPELKDNKAERVQGGEKDKRLGTMGHATAALSDVEVDTADDAIRDAIDVMGSISMFKAGLINHLCSDNIKTDMASASHAAD